MKCVVSSWSDYLLFGYDWPGDYKLDEPEKA